MPQIPGFKNLIKVYDDARKSEYKAIREQDSESKNDSSKESGASKESQNVILKILKTRYPSPAEISRFKHDYELLRNLRFDGIVHIYGVREAPPEGIVIIQEDFPGQSLKKVINGELPDERKFLDIALKLARTLGELHNHNIVHGDIKPHNILIDEAGAVKLTDFGFAAILADEIHDIYDPRVISEILPYISPEQTGRMNVSVDFRTDLYSLGVTYYELLTGKPPFRSSDPLELIHYHIARQPPPIEKSRNDISAVVSYIVLKLLSKTVEDRYQSAHALKADLEECRRRLEGKKGHALFKPGARDVLERFYISEKIYGRQKEIRSILDTFQRIRREGVPEFLFLKGPSGIGKSTLLEELYEPITSLEGLFVVGKYEQYARSVNYGAIIHAFQLLVREILTGKEDEIREWRDRFRAALGVNGQAIVEVIPELELIVGKQPILLRLEQGEEERFESTLLDFALTFVEHVHPLVIILDDMQWADPLSLRFIRALFRDRRCRFLLMIGAYRSEDVDRSHPIQELKSEFDTSEVRNHVLEISPLSVRDVRRLLSDTLRNYSIHLNYLAEMVHQKTYGNPFFVKQFVYSLYSDNLFKMDSFGQWSWDIGQVNRMKVTDNVVGMMAKKISSVDINLNETMKIAACLGSEFELETLAKLCDKSVEKTYQDIKNAVNEGFINYYDDYCAFAHERIREAAYFLLEGRRKKEVHLKIGRLLLERSDPAEREIHILEIAEQLNRGADLLEERNEKIELAKINYSAGHRARANTAYADALNFFRRCQELLGEDYWETDFDFTFQVEKNRSMCEFLCGNFEEAGAGFLGLKEKAADLASRRSIIQLLLKLYQVSGRYDEGVLLGLESLHNADMPVPHNESELTEFVESEKRIIARELQGKQIDELLHLPEMKERDMTSLLALMSDLLFCAYHARPYLYVWLAYKIVALSIKEGNTPESCIGYGAYAGLLGQFPEQFQQSQEFSSLSIALNAAQKAEQYKGVLLYIQSSRVNFRKNHMITGFPLLERAFQDCLVAGDLVSANYICMETVWHYIEGGEKPERVYNISRKQLAFARRSRNEAIYLTIRLQQQYLLNLQGMTVDSLSLEDNRFNEAEFQASLGRLSFGGGIALYFILKLKICYTRADYEGARKYLVQAQAYIGSAISGPLELTFHFYKVLTLLAEVAGFVPEDEILPGELERSLEILEMAAKDCPDNYSHKLALVRAEQARRKNEIPAAMDYYDEAISLAREYEYVRIEALAARRCGLFYLSIGKPQIARVYLRDAHYAYRKWGALGLVAFMEERYQDLLDPGREYEPSSLHGGEGAPAGKNQWRMLDTSAVMKAARTISGEIKKKRLLQRLIAIMLENAGAQKGSLFLLKERDLFLEAEGEIESGRVNVLMNIPLRECQDISQGIVNYVFRTRVEIVLDNAAFASTFKKDPYIERKKPRSILCIPILTQDSLTGVVYLENNLTEGAFTPDRLEVLRFLAAQSAVALENALLYEDMARAGDALSESEKKFRNLVENTIDGILTLLDGRPFYANPALLELLGYTESELKALKIKDFAPRTPEEENPLVSFQDPTHPVDALESQIEARLLRKDGEILDVLVSLSTTGVGGGTGMMAVIKDITERKRVERALKENEENLRKLTEELEFRVEERTAALAAANRALGAANQELGTANEDLAAANRELEAFSYTVSHDLRAPLRAINGYARAFMEDYEENLDSTGKSFLNRIAENAVKMGQLIEDLLKFSRLGRKRMSLSPVGAEELIEDVIQEIGPAYPGRRLRFIKGKFPQVLGDRTMLKQVFVNLISNAVKYSSNREEAVIEINGLVQGEFYEFYIKDNGVGFDMRYENKLFGVFQRLHTDQEFEGTGIGLSIVHRVIQRHGGVVRAHGEVNKGATFYFTLPLASNGK